MKILITGANGMLGKAIVKRFKDNELLTPTHSELDISNEESVMTFVEENKPELIINCAAFTEVNKVEYSEDAYRTNTLGPKYLATVAKQNGITLVHFSTDYVFDGSKPLHEFYKENSETRPLNSYGKTKEEGDQNIISIRPNFYIFRTSWLFGDGENFVNKILSLSNSFSELRIVDDQIGSPTYTEDLADIVYQVLEKKLPFGIYNATNLGSTSWCAFAKLFANKECTLIPVTSEEYGDEVLRPKNSQLSKDKIQSYGITIPMYEEALNKYLKTRGE